MVFLRAESFYNVATNIDEIYEIDDLDPYGEYHYIHSLMENLFYQLLEIDLLEAVYIFWMSQKQHCLHQGKCLCLL